MADDVAHDVMVRGLEQIVALLEGAVTATEAARKQATAIIAGMEQDGQKYEGGAYYVNALRGTAPRVALDLARKNLTYWQERLAAVQGVEWR